MEHLLAKERLADKTLYDDLSGKDNDKCLVKVKKVIGEFRDDIRNIGKTHQINRWLALFYKLGKLLDKVHDSSVLVLVVFY